MGGNNSTINSAYIFGAQYAFDYDVSSDGLISTLSNSNDMVGFPDSLDIFKYEWLFVHAWADIDNTRYVSSSTVLWFYTNYNTYSEYYDGEYNVDVADSYILYNNDFYILLSVEERRAIIIG